MIQGCDPPPISNTSARTNDLEGTGGKCTEQGCTLSRGCTKYETNKLSTTIINYATDDKCDSGFCANSEHRINNYISYMQDIPFSGYIFTGENIPDL